MEKLPLGYKRCARTLWSASSPGRPARTVGHVAGSFVTRNFKGGTSYYFQHLEPGERGQPGPAVRAPRHPTARFGRVVVGREGVEPSRLDEAAGFKPAASPIPPPAHGRVYMLGA